MGVEFDWYRQSVVNALFTAWRQPFSGGLREPVEVTVGFEILRDGSVRSVQIVSPSGDSRLDRSAFRAVQDASLPPLPRNYRVTAQPARFVFRLFPESGF
jgi:TonB family protein